MMPAPGGRVTLADRTDAAIAGRLLAECMDESQKLVPEAGWPRSARPRPLRHDARVEQSEASQKRLLQQSLDPTESRRPIVLRISVANRLNCSLCWQDVSTPSADNNASLRILS